MKRAHCLARHQKLLLHAAALACAASAACCCAFTAATRLSSVKMIRLLPSVLYLGSGSLGESHPQAPADPGVTVSRHRALLTNQSVRADPGPVSEQSGLSFLQPFPPLREPLVGPQPSILLPCPAPQVGADAS